MNVKFRVTFDDGTFLESHDESWNQIKDHAHALSPNGEKKWRQYDLIGDDVGHLVGVSFHSGLFVVRGQLIHTGDNEGGSYTFRKGVHTYKNTHKNTEGLEYFPIYGRKQIFGDWGAATLYFCGWKRMFEGKEVIKKAFVYPNGQIVIT